MKKTAGITEIVFQNYKEVILSGPQKKQAVYELASASKAFTAAALLVLEEKGRLNLNDPVSHYLPGVYFTWKGERVVPTVFQLLTHTAGLPHDTYKYMKDGEETVTECAGRMCGMELKFHPGSRFCYSTGGYCVLGAVIEKIAGISYARFMKQEIFEKLGMNGTFAQGDESRQSSPGRRRGLIGTRKSSEKNFMSFAPSGFICSTGRDIARWLNIQLQPKTAGELESVIRKSQDSRLYVRVAGTVYYGCGWYWDKKKDCFYHEGENPDFSACILFNRQGGGVGILNDIASDRTEKSAFAWYKYVLLGRADRMNGVQPPVPAWEKKDLLDAAACIVSIVCIADLLTGFRVPEPAVCLLWLGLMFLERILLTWLAHGLKLRQIVWWVSDRLVILIILIPAELAVRIASCLTV